MVKIENKGRKENDIKGSSNEGRIIKDMLNGVLWNGEITRREQNTNK